MMLSAWLSKNGEGIIEPAQEEELRNIVLAELADSGASEDALRAEVDQFIRNGRVSGTNLSRLRRRVERKAGSQSARGSQVGSIASRSEFSEGALSARLSSRGGLSRPMPGSSDYAKWSEVAQHQKLLEELDRQNAKTVKTAKQDKIRMELLEQMDYKVQKKAQMKTEDLRIFEHQKAEIQRFEAAETAKKDLLRKRTEDVNKERDAQTQLRDELKTQEFSQKMAEDRRLVKTAAADLARESKEAAEKKVHLVENMQIMAKEVGGLRAAAREEEKRKKVEWELLKVQEFRELSELQEKRNKQNIPKVRGVGTEAHPKSKRRGEEVYNEDNIMRQLEEAIKQKDAADVRKEVSQRSMRQTNQDFLMQQIEERNQKRRDQETTKGEQRKQVQKASEQFFEAERGRIETQRMKNVQHRQELQLQITARKGVQKDDLNAMSDAEKSINRHLIDEARELREKVSQMAIEGAL